MEAANEQGNQEHHDNMQALMNQHMFHQMKLEQIMRALENDQVRFHVSLDAIACFRFPPACSLSSIACAKESHMLTCS